MTQPIEIIVPDEVKAVETAMDASIQERGREPKEAYGLGLLMNLAQVGGLVPPWWSRQRDNELRRFWMSVNHLAGAFYTLKSKLAAVPFRIEARDASVKAHVRMADQFQQILEEESDFGQGWAECFGRFLLDRYTQDNGGFLEVIGDGKKDGPIMGPALGLAHLDSGRCQRTGSPEYPVVYTDTDSQRYRLHYTRVIYGSELPSPRAEMNGVGLCWTSRCIDVAQNMLDIATYKSEKLGSRPQRGIIVTQGGLDPEILQQAFVAAEHSMSDQGLSRFSKFVLVGSELAPDAAMQMIDLASLPDGFDEQQSITLGMFTIALAGGVPPRWLWPASESGATKADAMYQHVAGLNGGPGSTLAMIANAIGGSERGRYHISGKFLPPSLRMVFDFQDDEQDRTQAEIRELRSKQRTADLASGVINVRTAREQALASGDVSDAQFEALELEEGRLADGSPVLILFSDPDDQMRELLELGVDDPLDVAANIGVDMAAAIEVQQRLALAVLATEGQPEVRRKARQAIAALDELAKLYKGGGGEAGPTEETVPVVENVVPEETPAEGEIAIAEEPSGVDESDDDALENKSHNAETIYHPWPLCGNDRALAYPDHGGLLVCTKCARTYNPAVE
jgi:hypothetical protein